MHAYFLGKMARLPTAPFRYAIWQGMRPYKNGLPAGHWAGSVFSSGYGPQSLCLPRLLLTQFILPNPPAADRLPAPSFLSQLLAQTPLGSFKPPRINAQSPSYRGRATLLPGLHLSHHTPGRAVDSSLSIGPFSPAAGPKAEKRRSTVL